jgi:hypothetical protein
MRIALPEQGQDQTRSNARVPLQEGDPGGDGASASRVADQVRGKDAGLARGHNRGRGFRHCGLPLLSRKASAEPGALECQQCGPHDIGFRRVAVGRAERRKPGAIRLAEPGDETGKRHGFVAPQIERYRNRGIF